MFILEFPSNYQNNLEWMSFTTINEIETCPQKWLLQNSNYPNTWDHKGYPKSITISRLEGEILHVALKKITTLFIENKCENIYDEKAVFILRKEGGYNKIISDCVKDVLAQYKGNPRYEIKREPYLKLIKQKIPEIKRLLNNYMFRFLFLANNRKVSGCNWTKDKRNNRNPLGYGVYSELEVKSKGIKWRGRIDLLELSPEVCAIVDYKTGAYSPKHEEQIKIYSMLWYEDEDLNPSKNVANKLVLAYAENNTEIAAPDESELMNIKVKIKNRTNEVIERLKNVHGKVSPSVDKCAHCDVRHLCNDYWYWQNTEEAEDRKVYDVQAKIIREESIGTWLGIVESSNHLPIGKEVFICNIKQKIDIQTIDYVRMLDVYIQRKEDNPYNGVCLINLGLNSEIYVMPKI